ncbi:5981_t:CDS:2 [Cetraspora pellucida]|uniref:5981_t:CDS:1 n=1 Tax=Cetraspora pellucida TaxID=1433469 RepID=A0A9N9HJW3_9GLOM|nr:5981_t:CDS:2 [Cetraspora pellucida]
MPCYADTIIKVNQIHQTCNKNSKLFAIQAVGVYPIESKDCELNMTLFIPMNDEEKDPNSQSIFETNEYYCVGGKIMLESYNGNLRLKVCVFSYFGSNRCLLKVSLVGVAQDASKEINYENAILNVLVNDYARQIYRQMEIIKKDLYVYAVDISYVDTGSTTKKKVNIFENTSALYKSICLKLLNIYQNINEDSSKAARMKNSDLDNEKSKLVTDLTTKDFYIDKCTKVEDEKDDSLIQCNYKNSNKGKKKIIQPVVHNTKQWSELSKIINSSKRV